MLTIFNISFENGIIPKKWKKIIVKTLYKKKGNRRLLKNWRGIFLTSSISKIFEKMILNRQSTNIDNSFSEAAAGGRKDRSTLDHLFVVQAIIDYHKYIKCNIKFMFLDLEKAFDKLHLKSCLIDLYRSGVKGKCLKSIYELNKESSIRIDSPNGTTKHIGIGENLKQGTILAAPICANHIDKGVKPIYDENLGIRYGNILIPPLLYQDDIMIASISTNKMQEMLNILETYQKQNLLNFNMDKSECLTMKFNKLKRYNQSSELKLNNSIVKEVESYKYLGDMKNSTGTLGDNISNKKKAAMAITNEIKFLVDQPAFKKQKIEITLKLIETILIPKILYGCETWTNISKQQLKTLEKMQKDAVTKTNSIPSTTPYQGITYECGLMPITYRIKMKRLVYLRKMIKMKDSRLTKKVYKEQKRLNLNNCWNSEIKNDLKELNINISEKQIGKLTSKEWKNMIINRITSLIQRDMKECNKTKLRLIKDNCFGKKEYITHKDAANLLLLKLNMTDLKANYKGKHEDTLCRRCGAQEENIEHLFHCQNFKEKPLNSKNLLKTDPAKLGKIFEKVKTFLS